MAQTQDVAETANPERLQRNGAKSSNGAKTHSPVTFTSFDGEVLEIPDLPENLGRATALASEKTLSKIWGTVEEEKACRDMLKEM